MRLETVAQLYAFAWPNCVARLHNEDAAELVIRQVLGAA